MMSAPQSDAALVGQFGHVVRVNVLQKKTHQSRATYVRAEDPDIFQAGKFGEGIGAELQIVLGDFIAANRVQVIHGRRQADGARDVRCAGLEAVRGLFPRAFLIFHVENHFPAAMVRRHFFQNLVTPIERSNACGTAHFVAR